MDYLTLVQVMQALRMILDILIVWVIIYYIIKIVRSNNRTTQIFKGIIFVIVVQAIAKYFGLDTIAFLTDNIMNWGFLALIIIFQPEIRNILESFGKSNVFTRMSTLSGNEKEKLVQALMDAASNLSESKTGALITIEQSTSLSDYIKTGVPMNSMVTAELLCSIFATTTPLHDGAVIIQGDKLSCASAYFPPTTLDLPSRYGARHRAAIGISEITDAVTIVVSEETGRVAIAERGKLIQMNDRKLREYLNRAILNKETVTTSAMTPTSAESVSIDSLFKKEQEELEEEFHEVEIDRPNVAAGQTSVIVIDENNEKVVDEPVHKAQMKTFKKANFKEETSSVPSVESKESIKEKNTEVVEEEMKDQKPVEEEKKVDQKKPEVVDPDKGPGIFELLRKDKKEKKSDVELVVKEVAKEIHTTQQLKLKDIQAANEAANEAAKKKLMETQKLEIPDKMEKEVVVTEKKPTTLKSKVDHSVDVLDLPPVKPVEITRVNRQQSAVDHNQSNHSFLARRSRVVKKQSQDGGDQ